MGVHKVLLLGGDDKVSMRLTPLLLAKSWDVVSVVRNEDHKQEILVDSLDEVTSEGYAKRGLDHIDTCSGVLARAGGVGGPQRTKAIDQLAAQYYISSSVKDAAVKIFLMISYIASRKGYPKWWESEDVQAADKVNKEVLVHYYQAKVEADEHLAALAHKRRQTDKSFQDINLRPGTLTDGAAIKVLMGQTPARGQVSRATVAEVAAALLSRNDTRGWYDLCGELS